MSDGVLSHLDLPTQLQPGDREEASLRYDRAIELANYFARHPGPAGTVRYRIENLAGCQTSEHELDLLVEMVEHILDLAEWQRRKANPRRHPETTDWDRDGRAVPEAPSALRQAQGSGS